MARFPKGMIWPTVLLLLSQWACIDCVEEEALLLEEKDFCTVPGAADASACDWIVEQLEDQNPDLTYDFFCSKEKDCDSQFVEGEVVDWFSSGCNGPKIVNRLCGCCVFTPEPVPPPVQPECITSEDCVELTAPVCVSGSCVACAPTEAPPVQGNCPGETFCQLDGSCTPEQCDDDDDCGTNLVCQDNECKCELEGLAPREVDGVCIAPPGEILVFDSGGNPVAPVDSRRRLLIEGDALSFETIQLAIQAAEEGSTIYVGAGEYPESLLISEKNDLTIRGPNFGIPAYNSERDGPNVAARVSEAVITRPDDPPYYMVLVSGPLTQNVAMDGFELFQGPDTPRFSGDTNTHAFIVLFDGDGIEIGNTKFLLDEMDFGIRTANNVAGSLDPVTNVNIHSNYIQIDGPATPGLGFGIYLQGGLGDVTSNVVGSRIGIQVQPYQAGGSGSLISNTFRCYRLGIYLNYWQTFISTWTVQGNEVIGTSVPSGQSESFWTAMRFESIPVSGANPNFFPIDNTFLFVTDNVLDVGASDAQDRKVGAFFRNYRIPIGTVEGNPPSLAFSGNEFRGNEFDAFIEAISGFGGNTDFDQSQIEEVFIASDKENLFPSSVSIENDAEGDCCLVV